MDAIVTARIPQEIKEQGNEVLHKLGASPTQLINSAYQYVLAHGALPDIPTSTPSKLSEEDIDNLRKSIEESSFAIPESFWQEKSYKELIEEGRKADYEALA